MFCENMDASYIVDMSGTSEGTQVKYYKDGYWYKEDFYGGEARAEYLISGILQFSDLNREEYVKYEIGILNGKNACRSKNFLGNGEEFISLYRYYQLTVGRKLNEDILKYETPWERADFVLKFFREGRFLRKGCAVLYAKRKPGGKDMNLQEYRNCESCR